MRQTVRMSVAAIVLMTWTGGLVEAQQLFDNAPVHAHLDCSGPSLSCGTWWKEVEDQSEAPALTLPVVLLPPQGQKAPPPPAPRRSGFKGFLSSTWSDFRAFPLRKSTWVILAIGGASAALVHPIDDNVNDSIAGSKGMKYFFAPGKYIGSVPVQAGIATTLIIIGKNKKNDGSGPTRLTHLGVDLLEGLILSQTFTQAIKYSAQRDRPTGECCAFPSGHASAAFASASILERHLGFRAAWPTIAIASYVGASRLHDNRHFLSDVLFGSALGMASGWTVVGRHGKSEYTMMPAPTRGGVMVTVERRPRTSGSARTTH